MQAINRVIASASLTDNVTSGHMFSSIVELTILKALRASSHPGKVLTILQVDWKPLPCGWVKANMDGAARGTLGHAGGGGIFRDRSGAVLGCFAAYYGITCALEAKIFAAMFAITIAHHRGWHHLWLECDSMLVIKAFTCPDELQSFTHL